MKARLLAVSSLLLAGSLSFAHLGPAAKNDPDRYFNLRMASMVAEQGIVRQLPQFPDLGWNIEFPEKEFLYHQVLGVFHRVGGQPAAEAAGPLFAAGLVLAVFFFMSGQVGTAVAFFGALFLWIVNPIHFSRIVALRSYVWAGLLFFSFCWSLEKRKPLAAAVVAALLALSYHAFYIIFVPLAALVAFERGDRKVARCVIGALGGLAAGILVNPHFPESLGILWLGLELGAGAARLAPLPHGAELAGLGSVARLGCYSLPIFLAIGSVGLSLRHPRFRGRAAMCAVFLILSLGTFRATEYLVPAAALVWPDFWREIESSTRWRAGLAAVLVISVASAIPFWLHQPRLDERREVVATLSDRIPSGAKLVNGDWAIGAEIFYHRPDLRIVDALDSTMLSMEAPELSLLRDALHRGEPRDWARIFRDKFRAEWLLTRSTATVERLEKVPEVQIVKTYSYLNASGKGEILSLIRFAFDHMAEP